MTIRTLHLLRHAKSSWAEPGQADQERPLAARGIEACELLSGHIREAGIEPGATIVSPAVRTRQTYEGVAGALGASEQWFERRVYGASWTELLGILRELDDGFDSVMLIGHNPGIENLAAMLAGPASDQRSLDSLRAKYPTGGLASFELDGEWRRLRNRGARLTGFVKPKDLG